MNSFVSKSIIFNIGNIIKYTTSAFICIFYCVYNVLEVNKIQINIQA